MTTGYTGSYAINGVNLQLQPTNGAWEGRESLGNDGNGNNIYPQYRAFILKWGLMSVSDAQQINNVFLTVGNTGTVVVDLPKWGALDYQFYSYSGCIVSEMQVGEYFNQYITDVTVRISKVLA